MTIEERLSNLEFQVANINRSLIQQGRNASATTSKVDDTSNDVKAITPYKDSKVGYYGESEKTFYDVPEGNVLVFFSNYNGSYSVNRADNRITISFNALIEQTDITISVSQ